jgi:hypothetical protein
VIKAEINSDASEEIKNRTNLDIPYTSKRAVTVLPTSAVMLLFRFDGETAAISSNTVPTHRAILENVIGL